MPTDSPEGTLAHLLVEAIRDDFPRDVLKVMLRSLRDEILLTRPEPDVWIGGKENPYMKRWWLVPRRKYPFNVYLHHFLRSDDDRALHDHPWANLSVLIEGSYVEHVPRHAQNPAGPTIPLLRQQGEIVYRESGEISHRVELMRDGSSSGLRPVWTLFITGPKMRDWGFHCPQGWKTWQEFSGQNEDNGPVRDAQVFPGKGCGEA